MWVGYYSINFRLIILNQDYIKSTWTLVETLSHEYMHHWFSYLPTHAFHRLNEILDRINELVHYKAFLSSGFKEKKEHEHK